MKSEMGITATYAPVAQTVDRRRRLEAMWLQLDRCGVAGAGIGLRRLPVKQDVAGSIPAGHPGAIETTYG